MLAVNNSARAEWAQQALDVFTSATRVDDEDALKDLLCDLMHWADRNPEDCESFEAALRMARVNYEAEKKEEDEAV